MILTVAIVAIITVAALPSYRNFYIKYSLDAASDDLQQYLRTAQSLSMASQNDDQYGVHLVTGTATTMVVFKGTSYASRDTSFDELSETLAPSLTLSSTVSGGDVVFTKVEGSTTNTGTVTITSSEGDVHSVTVNAVGMIQLD